MALVHRTARLHRLPVVAAHPFITSAGERWARVDVGEHGELSVYGPPDALRRLAAALVVAADAADVLDVEAGGPEPLALAEAG
jgi:hypothetical protein